MKTAVYFCNCGTNIAGKIDAQAVCAEIRSREDFGAFHTGDFLCSEAGVEAMAKEIAAERPDRVVVAACSVREHEETFRGVCARAGVNPFLMQMVNIREQVAWMTADPAAATRKASRQVRAAMSRVALHDPLEREHIDVCPDAVVVGAGPAGLKAALRLAEAGRKVCLVEKGPVLGGLPVQYEEVFPNMECGPCMLEPALADVLHGPHAERIEVLTLSEVIEVVGSYGNFTLRIRRNPRFIADTCIACGYCIAACPATGKNAFNAGMNDRKAVDFAFQGSLPNLPYIDPAVCVRMAKQEECRACVDACPVPGAVVLDDAPSVVERPAGALLLATGGALYDVENVPNLAHGALPDVYTSFEFERLLASSGPTGGSLVTSKGAPPRRVAIVHCVGGLDETRNPYCSGICCSTAFKFNHLIAHKAPGARVTHFYKSIAVPGKEEFKLYDEARRRDSTMLVQYHDIDQLQVNPGAEGGIAIEVEQTGERGEFDMLVLCAAIVPSTGTADICRTLEIDTDRFGFVEELHGRMDSACSKLRGVYVAGTCQAPMDTQKAVTQGGAAAGYILAGLVPGRQLAVEPATASVDDARCSGCRTCVAVCPYKAITFDAERRVSSVNRVLCAGCGTCVAACPSAAIKGNHFTTAQIFAEIEQVLS